MHYIYISIAVKFIVELTSSNRTIIWTIRKASFVDVEEFQMLMDQTFYVVSDSCDYKFDNGRATHHNTR
jgi:hypothetical protein